MFKLGDKVVMATNTSCAIPVGAKGVVYGVRNGGAFYIVVDFGNTPSRQSRRIGNGWYMSEKELQHDYS